MISFGMSNMQKSYATAFKSHHLKACHYPKTNIKLLYKTELRSCTEIY